MFGQIVSSAFTRLGQTDYTDPASVNATTQILNTDAATIGVQTSTFRIDGDTK